MGERYKLAETHDQTQVASPDVNSTEGADEILRRAVEAEKAKGTLRLTPGQIALLKATQKDEEI